jgi:sterol desaturase/sphingolipid hydroxylase (fatty acid hydroxylase superfamily)/peptidoglycan/xylan/chitin deacetylase (PgdA/CDA1 family)
VPGDGDRSAGRLTLAVLGLVVAGAATAGLLHARRVVLDVQALRALRDRAIDATVVALPWPDALGVVVRPLLHDVLLAPHVIAAAAIILALERRYPARPAQAQWSPALIQDFVWYLAQIGIFSWIIDRFVGVLGNVYDRHLAFLTVPAVDRLPVTASVIVAIVVSDFLAWTHHVLRHKVRWCWRFHTVHHSQTRMNLWTDSRYHLVEYFVAAVVRFIPLLALKLDPLGIAWLAWLMMWYPRLYHANIRSNFGPLRFVLVTPQSHRIHHSVLPEHRDKNFGVLLCVWDRAFGTHAPDEDTYPDTGISDADFPHESGWRGVVSLRSLVEQMVYPFRWGGAGGRSRRVVAAFAGFLSVATLLLPTPAVARERAFSWPGGTEAAVALTYDDGLDVHLDDAVPDLDDAGLRGTFYLQGSSRSLQRRAEDWRAVARRGHELGNHSLTHACLRRAGEQDRAFVTGDRDLRNYTVARMVDELQVMNARLTALDGRVVRTFAYPCGDTQAGGASYVDAIRPLMRGARTLGWALADPRTLDPYQVAGWGVDGERSVKLIARVEDAIRHGTLAVFVFHGVGGGHPINIARDDHRAFLSWLDANRRRVWTAPLLEVIDYVMAERARIGAK